MECSKRKMKSERNSNDQRKGKKERATNKERTHLPSAPVRIFSKREREEKKRKPHSSLMWSRNGTNRCCNIDDRCSFGFIIMMACLRINKFAHTDVKRFTIEKSIEQETNLFTLLVVRRADLPYASSWLTIGILADCRVKRDFNRSSFNFGITLQLGDQEM